MRIAYFQPFSGASGDMLLGALVDAGLPLDRLEDGLSSLGLPGWSLRTEPVFRGAFAATRVYVDLADANVALASEPESDTREIGGHPVEPAHDHSHSHAHAHDHAHGHSHTHSHHHDHDHAGGGVQRGLTEILALIGASRLPERVKNDASRVFRRLGEAESRAHGIPVDQVHFHEVGAVDSIVDIVGGCLGLHLLEIEEVRCAPITVGTGFVRGDHGKMPLPAPATIALLEGFPIEHRDSRAELTTPTGAALLTTLAAEFGTMPPLTVRAVGYGAGDDRPGPVPNLLRVIVGEREDATSGGDRVLLLETNIDDMSAEWTSHLAERLFGAGALDVWLTPIVMKKGRAAQEVSVLVPPRLEADALRVLFAESTTFGVRRREVDRVTLEREFHSVDTEWGPVRVKIGRLGPKRVSAAPEHDDLRRVASASGLPLKEVHRRVMRDFDSGGRGDGRARPDGDAG